MKKTVIFAVILCLCASAGDTRGEEILTWEDCVREAAKNHPDLISAHESVNSSQADKAIAASGLFPQVGTDFNASRSDSSGGASGDESGAADSYSYGVNGSQLIFDGFQTVNNVNAAAENIKAARESYKFTSSQVRLRLRVAFINLLKAQEALRIRDEILQRRRQNFELVALRYESGMENKGSLLTEQANVRQAQFDVTQAGRDIELAERQLTKEMGRLELVQMTADGDFTVHDAAREKPDFTAIALNNPSLQQLIAQKNAAVFNVKSAKGEFLPSITASGNAGRSGSQWPPRGDEWSIGAAVSLPIFEGGKRFADISKANAQLNKAEADARSARDGVIEALQSAWTSLQDGLDNVDVKQRFLVANEERAKIAEAQYSIGFVSFNDWIIIEDNLVNAKNSYLDAQSQALISEANWIQAKGVTLENIE
jgi:TolC family type I secretion outer membrane protein